MAINFSNISDKNGIIQLIEFNCALGDGAISGKIGRASCRERV
jgi:hypothetical protein